jgi:hypothetical protein
LSDDEKQVLQDLAFQVQKRQRPDRHPYQIGTLAGLIASAASQLIIGIPPSTPLYDRVSFAALISVNSCFIVGGMLALIGAVLPRDHDPRLSLRIGMAAQTAIFTASNTYVFAIITAIHASYWLSVLSAGTGIGVSYASAHRWVQQQRALRDVGRVIKIVHPEIKQRRF